MIRRSPHALRIAILSLAWLLAAAPARAATSVPDWAAVADTGTIQIVATDAEGAKLERTIWLVVLDGRGYIRAGATSSWDEGLDANPEVTVRIADVDYELRATRIPEGLLYDQVTEAFRTKYGFSDALMSIVRGVGGTPRILVLEARRGIPMGP
jgi:hypothetical protein